MLQSFQKMTRKRDAELVIRLIERNNYEVFNILRCIAEISGLDFRLVCHAGVGKAWESIIYRMIQNGQCSRPLTTDRLKKESILAALFFNQSRNHILHQLKSLTLRAFTLRS